MHEKEPLRKMDAQQRHSVSRAAGWLVIHFKDIHLIIILFFILLSDPSSSATRQKVRLVDALRIGKHRRRKVAEIPTKFC